MRGLFANGPVPGVQPEKKIVWNTERIKWWLANGAQPSETVVKLLEKVRVCCSRGFFFQEVGRLLIRLASLLVVVGERTGRSVDGQSQVEDRLQTTQAQIGGKGHIASRLGKVYICIYFPSARRYRAHHPVQQTPSTWDHASTRMICRSFLAKASRWWFAAWRNRCTAKTIVIVMINRNKNDISTVEWSIRGGGTGQETVV